MSDVDTTYTFFISITISLPESVNLLLEGTRPEALSQNNSRVVTALDAGAATVQVQLLGPVGRIIDLSPRGADSPFQSDGDDGDGQGSGFWCDQHQPLRRSPFQRAAGDENVGAKVPLY